MVGADPGPDGGIPVQGVKLRHWSTGLLTSVVACLGLQAVPHSASAEECRPGDPDCSVDTGPSGGSVSIQFSGSGVSSVDGSSTSVPPDCWFQDGVALKPARDQRLALEVAGWFLPVLRLLTFRLAPLSDYQQALEDYPEDSPDYDKWKWYFLRCRPGINQLTSDEALSIAQTTDWFGQQVTRADLLLRTGSSTPSGVSVRTLLEAAQDAFTIPEPVVEQNPTARDHGGATLVNLDTWFWADNAQESYSITATAGPVSVTLDAVNTGYTLTSPYGSTECTFEQFTTAWEPALEGTDAGCRLAFDEAGEHEVDVSSTWEVTWTATGIPGTNTLDPITPSSAFTVPVIEQGSVVTDVD